MFLFFDPVNINATFLLNCLIFQMNVLWTAVAMGIVSKVMMDITSVSVLPTERDLLAKCLEKSPVMMEKMMIKASWLLIFGLKNRLLAYWKLYTKIQGEHVLTSILRHVTSSRDRYNR